LDMRFKKDMAMMDYQFKIAGEQRARAWDLEKMEIASRNDFSQEETLRVRKQEQWSLIEKQINETDILSDDQKKQALHENYLKIHGGVVPKQKSIEEQIMEQAFNEQRGQQGQGTGQGTSQPTAQPATQRSLGQTPLGVVETPEGMQIMGSDGALRPINQSGMVNVVNPSGERVKIKAAQLQEAIAEGYQFIGVAASSMAPTVQETNVQETSPYEKTRNKRVEKGLDPDAFNLVEAFAGSKPELLGKAISKIAGESKEERKKRITKRKKKFGFMNFNARGN